MSTCTFFYPNNDNIIVETVVYPYALCSLQYNSARKSSPFSILPSVVVIFFFFES